MKEQLITFETAKLAKEKGFDWKSNFYNWYGSDKILNQNYDLGNTILAPTQCLLQKWLREIHNIHVVLKPVLGSKNGYDSYPMLGWDYDIIVLNKGSKNSFYMGYPIGDWFTAVEDRFDENDTLEDLNVNPLNYEEALEKGLQEGLKLINPKQ